MKLVVRKDAFDEIMKKLEKNNGSEINKAGLPVGTIHGNYKKVSDNPSKWEFITHENVMKNVGSNDRRAYLANKAPLITGISELSANTKNYLTVGREKLADMQKEVSERKVICRINNCRVTAVNQTHIFKDKNSIDNQTMRVRALPFVFPIIEKFGVRGLKTVRGDSEFQEIVGKADLTNRKGIKKRCAIAVIVVRNKKTNRQHLTQLSVFVIDNKVIKSFDTDGLPTSRLVRNDRNLPSSKDSHFSACTSTIPQSAGKSRKTDDWNLKKSLTYSGHTLQGRMKLYGMDISIENKKGSYRSGTDSDGHQWRIYMHYDYGYIRETVGTDGDHVDCYIGSDKTADKVYIVHQKKPGTKQYDEDKCMLCFDSAENAKKAYMKQYDRPGFFGGMETMSVEEFKSYVFSRQGCRIHKSFDITVADITENNKQKKLEQTEKALNALYKNTPFVVQHVPADNSKNYGNLTLRIRDFDRDKISKAVHKMAFSLDTQIKSAQGEAFMYKAQEELTDSIVSELTEKTKAVYSFLVSYFGLPEVRIISKADLTYKGKVIYDPESGKPISEAEWKRFVAALEKFLNRNYTGTGKKIVLSAESLGRILERLARTNSLEAVRKMPLSDLKYKGKTFDWISDSVKNMRNVFGESLDRAAQARVQVAIDSAAQRITGVSERMRNDIQQIIIDGVRNKESRAKVSQNLFDKCSGLNRDFQRISDTEIQNATNTAYLKECVHNSEAGKNVYFRRFEEDDDNTCKKCKAIKDVIVLWSDVPLESEKINDPYAEYAIWEGKTDGVMPVSTLHPYCRGCWVRVYPELEKK